MYIKWKPPPKGYFKLNTDGELKQSNTSAGFEGVFRDTNGDWVMGYAGQYPSTNITNIELMTLFRGL